MRFELPFQPACRAATLLMALQCAVIPVPSSAEIYQDRLIEPDAAGEVAAEAWEPEAAEPEGRRFYSIEYQHYHQDYYDTSDESGLLFQWRRETLEFGDLSLDATMRNGGESDLARHSTGGQFTFRQRGFALNESRNMDNTAGVMRSVSDPMISSSFRLNLPSTLMGGAYSHISSPRDDIYIGAGRIGRLDPTQIQGFEDTQGDLFSMGYSRSFRRDWRAGTHLVHVTGSEDVKDHQSLASALQYQTPDLRQRYLGHVLLDSEGNNGLWVDGDTRAGIWRNRYGLFRLEPGLQWTDTSPTDDQQGGYLRSEMARLRFNFSAGLELTQTNIDDRPDRSGIDLYNAFMNGNWRQTYRTSLGSTLSARASEPRNGIPVEKSRDYLLSGYVTHDFPIGTSRLQLSASRLERDDEDGNGIGFIWDQEWNIRQNLGLASTLSHDREHGLADAQNISTAALLVHHEPDSRFYWNGDVSYSVIDSDQDDNRRNIFASLSLYWRFLPDWDASLRATHNRVEVVSPSATAAASVPEDETTLLVSLRYSHSSGRPFIIKGQQAEGRGFGEVSGVVFYDANADGVRQAGEAVASGIYVYLDRSYETVTDNQGRYTFEPVASGPHEVNLALEDLPLPWGLLDETPRRVSVGVRQRSEVDFALQEINQ
ncbi:MAG TPA: SdrD B-like domain-containing protein [Gammaproteobacteria bacterium]|nr:SdrD B-like domain-containing protein [Gammaproteobacteria bacterium]